MILGTGGVELRLRAEEGGAKPPVVKFWADIALTLRVRLVTFPQDLNFFSKSIMDGDPALWRLSQRRFS
jgi:hypothetical protein